YRPGRAPALGLRTNGAGALSYRRPAVRRRLLRARRAQTMLSTTLLLWLRRRSRSGRRSRTASRPAFVPRLLVLEDRTLLSTITVLTNAASGPGSLRAAIADAQSGDQIVFDPSLYGQTITLTSGQLAVSKSLDIEGPGADQLAVSGNHQSRVFA